MIPRVITIFAVNVMFLYFGFGKHTSLAESMFFALFFAPFVFVANYTDVQRINFADEIQCVPRYVFIVACALNIIAGALILINGSSSMLYALLFNWLGGGSAIVSGGIAVRIIESRR